eukprot:SAG31_NODE_1215_length_9335_cov_5.846470_2_plen_49_part_00
MYGTAVRFTQDLPEGVDQQSNCACGGKQVLLIFKIRARAIVYTNIDIR